MKAYLRIFAQYVLAFFFAIALILVTELAFQIQSYTGMGNGFDFLLVSIIAALALSILFYSFTGRLPVRWKVISYFLTLTLWIIEQYFISDFFYDFVFRSGLSTYTLIVLSALLWVSNKIIVEAGLANLVEKDRQN